MRRLFVCSALVLGCSASAGPGERADPRDDANEAPDPSAAGGAGPSATGGMPAAGSGGMPGVGGGTPGAGAGGANSAGGTGTDLSPGSDGGTAAPTYDPNVGFDWPETDPNIAAECPAGRYVGTFAGFYNTFLPVSGNVDMTLTESQDGEFLEVSDGTMSGVANLTIPFSAEVEGTLDCETLRFEAELVNGTYDAFGSMASFAGPLVADYDALSSQMVSGTWNVTEPGSTNGGMGDWQAAWMP